MKTYTVSITSKDTAVRTHLAAIFNYLCKQQLTAAGLKPSIVATGRVLQGEVIIYTDTAYDTLRAELFISNAAKTVNLFNTDNGNFESYTDSEKEKLALMLKSQDKAVKLYYDAIKALMKLGVYPPYSMQEDLIKQASTFKLADEQEEQELNSLITENVKGSDLQTGSWVWKAVTETRNDRPLRKSLTLLAVALRQNGIANAEDLRLITSTFSHKMYTIGNDEIKRIALQDEVNNAANIRNISIAYIPLYNSTEAYLTAVLHSLYAPAAYYIKMIHYHCTAADSTVRYDLRFNNVAPLQTILNQTVSNTVLFEEFKKFILDNIQTFEAIIAQLLIEIPTLVKKWRGSTAEITYPTTYDELQIYYEYQNIDIDTLDALLAIEADTSNIVAQLKQVKDAGVRGDYDKVPYDIACKGLTNIKKFGNHKLTPKQLQVIERRVQSLNKTIEMSKDIDAAACIEIATTLKNNHKQRMNNVISNIVDSTLRYGICSQKQLDTMKLALVGYQQEVEQSAKKTEQKQGQQGIMFNIPGMPLVPAQQQAAKEEQQDDTENTVVTTDEAAKIVQTRTESAYKSAFGIIDDDDDDDNNSPW